MKNKLLIFFFGMLLFSYIANAFDYTNGLMAFWTFEGNTEDNSTNNKDWTISGATYNATGGINGTGAYYFDNSNDYMNITDLGEYFCFDMNNASCVKSVFCWVKPIPLNNEENVIISKWSSNSGAQRFAIEQDTALVGSNDYALADTDSNNLWIGGGTGEVYRYTFIGYTLYQSNSRFVTYNNATLIINNTATDIGKTGNNNPLAIGSYSNQLGTGGQYGGYIDDCGIWNRTLSPQEVKHLYSSALNGTRFPFTESTPPSILPLSNFISASPNLSIDTNINLFYNISFNMSNGTSLYRNDSRIFINYSLNGTGDLFNYVLNGTEFKGFRNKTQTRINGDIVNFSLDDNDIYFTVANLNPEDVEDLPHINFDCNATLCLYNTWFKGFTQQMNNYLELDLSFDGTGTVTNLYSIGLCNQANISNPLTSANCTLLKQDFNVSANHYHTLFGNHSVIGFLYNNSRVNGLFLGSDIYVYTYFANTPTKRYRLGVVEQKTRDSTFVRIQPVTETRTDYSMFTPDMHIHQNNSKLIYKGCFYDTGNNLVCSNLVTQTIGFLQTSYSPIFFTFPNSTINNVTNPTGNLTLLSWNSPIGSNNATPISFKLYYFNGSFDGYTLINDSATFNTGFYWYNNVNRTDTHFRIDVTMSDGSVLNTISTEVDFLYFDVPDSNTYWLQQINSNVIQVNASVLLIYEVIKMIGVILVNFIFILAIWYLSKELSRYVILLEISPLLNLFALLFQNIDVGVSFITSANLNLVMLLNTIVLFIVLLLLWIFYLLIPKPTKQEVKRDFYGELKF